MTSGHAAIFEVRFGKTSERAVKESRERSAEQLFADLEPVASAVEGSDLGPSEDPFEPTASCINDTKKRQPVTRSGLPSDVIARDANAAAYKYYKKQERQDLHDSSVAVMLREMQREVNTGHPIERKLHMDYSTNSHPTQLHGANDTDCSFMAIHPWGKPAGPRIMRKLWSNLKPNRSINFREQIAELLEQKANKKEKSTEDISREQGVEIQLRMAAQGFYRGRHRSNGGTSRLWSSPIRENPETPKQ